MILYRFKVPDYFYIHVVFDLVIYGKWNKYKYKYK